MVHLVSVVSEQSEGVCCQCPSKHDTLSLKAQSVPTGRDQDNCLHSFSSPADTCFISFSWVLESLLTDDIALGVFRSACAVWLGIVSAGRRIVIGGRKGMPCFHTTGVLSRPWLLASCSPDAAATVPSMGSLDLSEESMTRVGEAPVRGRPPTMSKLSPTEINRLLLLSCSEVAP